VAGDPQGAPALWRTGAPPEAPLLTERIRPIEPSAPLVGRVLLSAGDSPLIIGQDEPRRIAVLLDMGALEHRPELPALLALLLDRLAGRDLLMPSTSVRRDPFEAQVAPGPLPRARPSANVPAARREAAPWLLGAALALALYDLVRRARSVGTG
jgi:hypothetical protein